jgi:hypothetical protein
MDPTPTLKRPNPLIACLLLFARIVDELPTVKLPFIIALLLFVKVLVNQMP